MCRLSLPQILDTQNYSAGRSLCFVSLFGTLLQAVAIRYTNFYCLLLLLLLLLTITLYSKYKSRLNPQVCLSDTAVILWLCIGEKFGTV
jgi:hypothetical protein